MTREIRNEQEETGERYIQGSVTTMVPVPVVLSMKTLTKSWAVDKLAAMIQKEGKARRKGPTTRFRLGKNGALYWGRRRLVYKSCDPAKQIGISRKSCLLRRTKMTDNNFVRAVTRESFNQALSRHPRRIWPLCPHCLSGSHWPRLSSGLLFG